METQALPTSAAKLDTFDVVLRVYVKWILRHFPRRKVHFPPSLPHNSHTAAHRPRERFSLFKAERFVWVGLTPSGFVCIAFITGGQTQRKGREGRKRRNSLPFPQSKSEEFYRTTVRQRFCLCLRSTYSTLVQ